MTQRSAASPSRSAASSSSGPVADDRDPRRLEPERERLAREERAVQVGALAADELAARDDDRGPRPGSSGFGALPMPLGESSTATIALDPSPGSRATPPVDRASRGSPAARPGSRAVGR